MALCRAARRAQGGGVVRVGARVQRVGRVEGKAAVSCFVSVQEGEVGEPGAGRRSGAHGREEREEGERRKEEKERKKEMEKKRKRERETEREREREIRGGDRGRTRTRTGRA